MNDETTNINMTQPAADEDKPLTAKEKCRNTIVGSVILAIFYYICYAAANAGSSSEICYSRSFFEHFTPGGFVYFFKHFSVLKEIKGWGFFRIVLHDLSGILVGIAYLLFWAAIIAIAIYVIKVFLFALLPTIGRLLGYLFGGVGVVIIWTNIRYGDSGLVLLGVGLLVLAFLWNRLCMFIATKISGWSEGEIDDAIEDGYWQTH